MKELEFTGEFVVPNKTPYATYQEHINRYVFASNFVKDKTVLDIACGTGYGSSYLARKGAKRCLGGDISKKAIEYGKAHYSKRGLFFIRLDACDLPFPNECFDIVVAFETIEHLKEYVKFLCECKRVLKEGGLFICSSPNKQISSPFLSKPLNPFHFHEFHVKEFYCLLNEYFSEVALYGQNFANPVVHLTKLKWVNMWVKILEGIKLKNFVKRALPCTFHVSDIAKLGNEISDKLLDKKYEVLPFKSGLFKTPTFIIAVAKK